MNNDLEDRLIRFSVTIIDIAESMTSQSGLLMAKQLIRSGTSCSLNYGEAKAAESRKDFIHKMKISLKELRETFICLKIIDKSKLVQNHKTIDSIIDENNQLISIFIKSVHTASKHS